jgi:hypothetical protein
MATSVGKPIPSEVPRASLSLSERPPDAGELEEPDGLDGEDVGLLFWTVATFVTALVPYVKNILDVGEPPPGLATN